MSVRFLLFGLAVLAGGPVQSLSATSSYRDQERYFTPPPEFAGQLGKYRSPLLFKNGARVESAAEWPRRRAEILHDWQELMGPWPAVLQRPRLEVLQESRRENFTQKRVRIEIAPNQTGEGWLLVPDGTKPKPAVLVVFYEPESSIGLNPKQPTCDFGLQLARRGFVTLSIGTPGGDAWKPETGAAVCQPLSFHAYVAANCWQALASLPEVNRRRIGVVGHSYGGKWSMFAGALWDKFAAVAVSDPGIVFDETRPNVNYWEPWYLGLDSSVKRPKAGIPSADNPRTGAYRRMIEQDRDLHELHALIAPRPFFVSGGSEDPPSRWTALNHLVQVNRVLGFTNRVAMTNREHHTPTQESNALLYAFFEHFLANNTSPLLTTAPVQRALQIEGASGAIVRATVSGPPFHAPEMFAAIEDYHNPRLKRLRVEYGLDKVVAGEPSEFRRLLKLRHWLHTRWPIDNEQQFNGDAFAILEKAKGGAGFNCSHSMAVQHAVMVSMGFVVRDLGVDRNHEDLGRSMHHGVNEVWSNDYAKWVLLDAKYDTHYERDGVPLSALELHEAVRADGGKGVVKVQGVERLPAPPQKPEAPENNIRSYWWVSYNLRPNPFTEPHWSGSSRLLIFDNDAYRNTTWYRGNDSGLVKHWAYAAKAFVPTRDRHEIEWTPGVTDLRARQVAPGELEVQLRSATPNFKCYLARVNGGSWQPLTDDRARWILHTGDNRFEARTQNLGDVEGPVVAAVVEFKEVNK